MTAMDIFKGSAFSMNSLTGAIEKVDYKPNFLGSLGIFDPVPSRTKDVWVDRRDSQMNLIQTSLDGTPPEELDVDNRDALNLKTVRIAKGFTLWAHEVAGLRAFGSEVNLETVQAEYIRRAARVRDDVELTEEYHRLGALQGKLLDADGTTVIYDYFTEFAEAEQAAVSFELDVASTDVRQVCQTLVRSMARSSKGSFTNGTSVHALAGDSFYDALISHPAVKETYLNWAAASDLRDNKAFGAFTFGGITFHNYRGTDDNSTVAVPVAEAKFFPIGARDVFKKVMSPHPSMEYVNTLGRPLYMGNILDRDRNMWTKGELYAYPLYLCQKPRSLRKGTLT